jgi:hypothetical protein
MRDMILIMKSNCKGNALLYILIAVALLAALSYTLSGNSRGQQTNQLDSSRTKLLATELIKHAVAAEMAVFQMQQWGVDYDEILFDLPGTAGYSTNTNRQIYHPNGGGLQPMANTEQYRDPIFSSVTSWHTWQLKNTTNVEWSPSSATDVIYSLGVLGEQVCSEVNKQLNDIDDAIAPTSGLSYQGTFLGSFVGASNLTTTTCPNCEGLKSACIERPISNPFRVFYTIIGSR